MKKAFLLKNNWGEIFDNLSDKQAGLLIKSLFRYNVNGEKPVDLNDLEVKAYFNMMLLDCDTMKSNYDRRCETSAQNGSLGGRPRNLNNLKKPNSKPKKPNNLSKPDNENENDKEEEEKEKESVANAPLPPPPSIINSKFKLYSQPEDIKACLMAESNQAWRETVCMSNKIHHIDTYLNAFLVDYKAYGHDHEQVIESRLKSHFSNWLKKHLLIASEKQQKGQSKENVPRNNWV